MKAYIKLSLLLVWIALWYVPAWICWRMKKYPLRDRMVQICYLGILRIAGIELKVTGHISEDRPLMLVSNHVSYLDVVLLGSQGPVHFTPKSEISGWPAIGSICRICDSVFIDRRPDKVVEVKQQIKDALAADNVISLFPEGTTGDGLHLQSFKSGFFQLAEEGIDGEGLVIQPVAISYTHIRKLPIDFNQWPSIAWYGDMMLVPHLINVLNIGPVNAEITFLEPVTIDQYDDRKKLAIHCHKAIAECRQAIRDRHLANPKGKRNSFHPRFLRVKP